MGEHYDDEPWLPDHLQEIDDILSKELKARCKEAMDETRRLKEERATSRKQKADDLRRFEGQLAKITDLEAIIAKGAVKATQEAGLEYLRSIHQDGVTVGDRCYWVSPVREKRPCLTCKGEKSVHLEGMPKGINCPHCHGQGVNDVLASYEVIDGYINNISFHTENGYDLESDQVIVASDVRGTWTSYGTGYARMNRSANKHIEREDLSYNRKVAEERCTEKITSLNKEALAALSAATGQGEGE